MKKFLLSFLALTIAVFTAVPTWAADYTVEPNSAVDSYALPIYFRSNGTYGCITQQIYLASELTNNYASTGADITAIKFYYGAVGAATNPISRSIKVFLLEIETEKTVYEVENTSQYTTGDVGESKFFANTDNKPGTQVYVGKFDIPAMSSGESGEITISFDNSFPWDGTSNLVLTIFDMSEASNTIDGGLSSLNPYNHLRFKICKTGTGVPRFLHRQWLSANEDDRNDWLENIKKSYGDQYSTPLTVDGQQKNRSYVAKATFTIVPSIPQPTLLDATSISSSSATINWTAAEGAESYEIRYGTTSGSLGAAVNVGNVTSYTLTGLEDETLYYYQIRTKIGSDYSAWTDESSFPTLAASPFVYKDITFSKWNSTTSMPTSGNYYLNTDVELSANASISGNLNLCLNGHKILTTSNCIIVPDGVTFAIFDCEGSGIIRGAVSGDFSNKGLISNHGTLIISEGSVVNLADEEKDYNTAVYNNGTLKLSGTPVISGVNSDIYLNNSRYITIESGKPLTNTTPYSVNAVQQVITSGWSNMGGANPSDYFTSAKSGYAGLCLNGSGEAQLVRVMSLDQEEDNASAISSSTYASQLINVSLARSLTSAQYNTFCLPFALTDAKLQSVFGVGYDLQELTGSSLDGETLSLEFTQRTALEAGKPYLLQPSANVTNPVFEGVTITATSPGTSSTTYVDYKAVYFPTSLEGGNRNLLFLGAGNELFWPESTGNLNGFRAYFEIKGASAQAAKRARISMGGKIATGNLSPALPKEEGVKILRDGKLYLMYKGQMYDVQGKRI